MPHKKQRLPQDQIEYWLKAVSDVKPIKKPNIYSRETNITVQIPKQHHMQKMLYPMELRCGLQDLFVGCKANVDSKTVVKMDKGQFGIDAEIDLHGYTLDRALQRVEQFIHDAWHLSYRMLLIITGKGRQDGASIKNSLVEWLNTKNLRPYILRVSTAHHKDGGKGAFYVLLKRNR